MLSPNSWLSSILKPGALGLTVEALTSGTVGIAELGEEVATAIINEQNQVQIWRHVCW